jgi:phospholipase/carboxylesterase
MLAAREQLREFLDRAMARYPIDPARLVVLGFSQGGVMAYSLGLQTPQRFAALAALSTWLPPALLEQLPAAPEVQRLPGIVQHGARDDVIQVDQARQAVAALRKWRMPLTYREYDMGHEINGQSLTDLTAWLEATVLTPLGRPQ